MHCSSSIFVVYLTLKSVFQIINPISRGFWMDQCLFASLRFMSQVLLGWKYGDCVDEKTKTHPQLRIYKALTEKVKYSMAYCRDNLKINGSRFVLCSQFLSLCFRRKRFTDCQLGTHWRACWWWAGASTEPRMERACLSKGRMRKWEKYLKLLR